MATVPARRQTASYGATRRTSASRGTLVLAWHGDRYRSQAAQAFVELAR
jgi:hypothetical protein